MQKQRTRSSIDDKYKWDLTKIYKTNDDFYKDLDVLKSKIEEFSKYETNVFESKEILESYLNLEDEVERLFNKLFTYLAASALIGFRTMYLCVVSGRE